MIYNEAKCGLKTTAELVFVLMVVVCAEWQRSSRLGLNAERNRGRWKEGQGLLQLTEGQNKKHELV